MAVTILGAWAVATLFMWFAATKSFTTVDRVLKTGNPQFVEATKTLAADQARMVLRYPASKINRAFFWGYGALQVVLAVILLSSLRRQTPRDTMGFAIVWGILCLVLVLTLVITPLIVSLGRSIDFAPRNPPPPVMPRFWALHGVYKSGRVKFLAGLGLLLRWILK